MPRNVRHLSQPGRVAPGRLTMPASLRDVSKQAGLKMQWIAGAATWTTVSGSASANDGTRAAMAEHGNTRRNRIMAKPPFEIPAEAAPEAAPFLALVTGPMLGLALEDELAQIRHALGVEDAVQVIAFMLDDTGVEAAGRARDRAAFVVEAAIADMGGAL